MEDINAALPSHQVQRVDTTPEAMPFKGISWIDNKSILTPTGGFLASGYTHTLNPYVGCAYARSTCGTYCYAQHQHWITKGRPWGLYGGKHDIRQAYQRDYDRIKHPRQGTPRPLRIYMASSTDPYVPQEPRLGLTRAILEEMQLRPPDVLVIQTHTTLISRDFDLIQALSQRCELWVSITVETDMDPVPGFPPHASRPAKRLETLKRFREAGVPTQAAISPLMPLADLQTFAQALDDACDRVIIDHYLLGDGSHGARTKRTNFLQLLDQAGFGEWAKIEKLWEVRDILAQVLGAERVLVSAAGFNAVGSERKSAQPCTDTEISDPPGGDIPIFRLNQEKEAPQDVYEPLRDHEINAALRSHQLERSEVLSLLHTYLPQIIERFYGDLPLPALSWEPSHWRNLGWYVEEDGLTLCHRINLNSLYANRPLSDILRTLTHELGHLHQRIYGKSGKHNYHNKAFQAKMLEIGIPCNKRGVSLGMMDPFVSFLKELGVEADTFPFKQERQIRTAASRSRLRAWSCGCTRVWASSGVTVSAACTKKECGNPFQPQ
jgi:DNA repair photolyase